MELLDAICQRRSIRKFKPDAVPVEDIRELVRLATLAPSASNKQMWKFVIVSNRKVLEDMKATILKEIDWLERHPESEVQRAGLQAARRYCTVFMDAPTTIVVLGEGYRTTIDDMLEERGLSSSQIDARRQRPDIQSVAAAIENLCLCAHAMGYGTCWMTGPCVAGPMLRDLLDQEPNWQVIALIPIGIPDEQPKARPRKPVDEVLEFID